MAHITLKADGLAPLRSMNPCLVSCNVEITEAAGGAFRKAYTEAQTDGTVEARPAAAPLFCCKPKQNRKKALGFNAFLFMQNK